MRRIIPHSARWRTLGRPLGLACALALAAGCAEDESHEAAFEAQTHNIEYYTYPDVSFGSAPDAEPAERQWRLGQVDGRGGADLVSAFRYSGALAMCHFGELRTWFCTMLPAGITDSQDDGHRFQLLDVDGDGRDELLQTGRRWQNIPVCSWSFRGWSCADRPATIYDYGSAEQQFLTGDFNGDGRGDVFQTLRSWGSIPTCTSTAANTWSCSNPAAAIYNSGSPEQRFLGGDFNGDGRTDIIQTYRGWGSIPTCYSTGSSWSCVNSPAAFGDSGSAEQTWVVLDHNGDGRDDVVTFHREWRGYHLCASTGTGWSCSWRPHDALGKGTSFALHSNSGSSDQQLLTGDYDGNGADDLAFIAPGWGIGVCFGSSAVQSATDCRAGDPAGVGSAGSITRFAVGDVDADGRDEIVVSAYGWTNNQVCDHDGTRFVCEWPVGNAADAGRGRFLSLASEGARLEHTCVNASVSTRHCDQWGACVELKREPCFPYACAAGTGCKSMCTSNADCAPSAQCNSILSKCGQPLWTCKDAFTMQSPAGVESTCRPYKCESGECRDTCATQSDCAEGHECRSQRCVVPPP